VLAGRVQSLATYKHPTLYIDGGGVQRIDPLLRFHTLSEPVPP